MSTTVRGLVRAMQVEIREASDLQPDRASELLVKLTALLGNCNDEIREADLLFAQVLLDCFRSEKAANRARVLAETTPAYQRKREARDCKELAIELIRSLKYFLKAKQEEMQLTR